jgi:hypothetical protein
MLLVTRYALKSLIFVYFVRWTVYVINRSVIQRRKKHSLPLSLDAAGTKGMHIHPDRTDLPQEYSNALNMKQAG